MQIGKGDDSAFLKPCLVDFPSKCEPSHQQVMLNGSDGKKLLLKFPSVKLKHLKEARKIK